MTIPTGVRALVRQRDGHRCLRCDRSILDSPASIHHRVPRRMGGTSDPRSDDPRNLVTLCGTGTTGCHGWVESNRNEARESGWLLRDYSGLDDAMYTPDRVLVMLDEDGGIYRYDYADEPLPLGGDL